MPGCHGGGACNCRNDEEVNDIPGITWLNPYVSLDQTVAFGEAEAGSSAGLFRAYSQRLDDSIVCRSEEDDPNIVIQVVFECPVKITSLLVIGGPNGHSPTKLRLFANHPNPDFSTITECGWETQALDLIEDFCGAVEYPVKVAKFAHVSSLSMHFPANNRLEVENDDEDDISTIIHWIGIKGVASGTKRSAVVSVYESQANLKDHEVKDDALGGMNFGIS